MFEPVPQSFRTLSRFCRSLGRSKSGKLTHLVRKKWSCRIREKFPGFGGNGAAKLWRGGNSCRGAFRHLQSNRFRSNNSNNLVFFETELDHFKGQTLCSLYISYFKSSRKAFTLGFLTQTGTIVRNC